MRARIYLFLFSCLALSTLFTACQLRSRQDVTPEATFPLSLAQVTATPSPLTTTSTTTVQLPLSDFILSVPPDWLVNPYYVHPSSDLGALSFKPLDVDALAFQVVPVPVYKGQDLEAVSERLLNGHGVTDREIIAGNGWEGIVGHGAWEDDGVNVVAVLVAEKQLLAITALRLPVSLLGDAERYVDELLAGTTLSRERDHELHLIEQVPLGDSGFLIGRPYRYDLRSVGEQYEMANFFRSGPHQYFTLYSFGDEAAAAAWLVEQEAAADGGASVSNSDVRGFMVDVIPDEEDVATARARLSPSAAARAGDEEISKKRAFVLGGNQGLLIDSVSPASWERENDEMLRALVQSLRWEE